MGRLHCFLDHRKESLAQLIEVDLIAQRSTEGSYDLRRIIFAAVEAAVNDGLDAAAQRLEYCVDDECGSDEHQGRL